MNIATPIPPLAPVNLEQMGPSELESRRRQVRDHMLLHYGTYENMDIPEDLLRELASITATLRRKTAGPPKKPKVAKPAGGPKATLADL